eukprot:364533-Chlamydomonas_euryale.AAC.15
MQWPLIAAKGPVQRIERTTLRNLPGTSPSELLLFCFACHPMMVPCSELTDEQLTNEWRCMNDL